MSTKWTIRKYPIREDGLRPLFPWFVFPPGVTPPDDHKKAFMAPSDIRATFSEALACVEYRTRKARTVEVVLPKVEYQKTLGFEYEDILVTRFGNSSTEVNVAGLKIALFYDDYKPLGEYLIALHYEKENNGIHYRAARSPERGDYAGKVARH